MIAAPHRIIENLTLYILYFISGHYQRTFYNFLNENHVFLPLNNPRPQCCFCHFTTRSKMISFVP
jgi:hypothetical protein